MGLAKLVALFLLGTSVVVSATSENYFPHFLFKRATTEETCTEAGISCVEDCKAVRICTPMSGGKFKESQIDCAVQDPSKPYCNGQACSASKSPDCDSASSGFVCTDDGYFPDPDDCTKYYICVGETAYEFPCDKYYVYNHALSYCVKKKLSSDCAVIKCKSTALFEYVVYPKDPNVYGLCIKDEPTTVFRCPEGEEFDVAKAKCSVACKSEGLKPVGTECSSAYIQCKKISSTKYEAVELECPSGMKFDETKCVVGACEEDTTPAPDDSTPAPDDSTPAPADSTPAPADTTPAPTP